MSEAQSNNPVLFVVGLIAMVLSISLFAFSLYITPFMLFNFTYEVPTFIILLKYWYETVQGLSGIKLIATILLPFILSAIILAFIAKRLTKRIEGEANTKIALMNFHLEQNYWFYIRPALYEILLIFAVLFFLYLAVYIIIIQFY